MAAAIAAAQASKSGFISFSGPVPLGRAAAAAKRKREAEKAAEASSSSDSEDSADGKKGGNSAAKAKAAPPAAPSDPKESVAELAKAAKGEEIMGPMLVRRFVRAVLHDWEIQLAKKGKAGDMSAPPTGKSLQPLIDLVEMRAPGDTEAAKVEKACRHCLSGEFLQAEEAYLQLTIGNVKWPIGGGNFTSSDGPRAGNRCWGVKDRKVDVTASVLDDGAQKEAIQGLKRLMTFLQSTKVAK